MTEDGSAHRPKVGERPNTWRRLKGVEPGLEPEEGSMPDSWEGKGDVLHDAGKLSEALECYTRGLTDEPKDLDLWMKKADIFLDQKRYRSCLFCIDQALRLDPSQADLWLMRGIMLHRSGDEPGAIESINYSLSLKAERPAAWAVKGAALLNEDRIEEARNCLEYGKEMASGDPDVEALAEALAAFVQESKKCPICDDMTKDGRCEKCLSKVAIDDGRISIAKARESSIDVTEAEGLLEEAKNFHEKKFYGQTIKVLKPLEKILGEDQRGGAYMLSIIDEAEEIALSLEADNMTGTNMIRKKIAKSNEVQENGQPLKAIVKAREALDLANKIARKYSDLLLKEPEKKKRKKEEMEGPVCPSCGEEVETAWVKCPVCKAQLGGDTEGSAPEPTTSEALPADQPKTCPKCGEEVEAFWVKCLFCQGSLTSGGGGG